MFENCNNVAFAAGIGSRRQLSRVGAWIEGSDKLPVTEGSHPLVGLTDAAEH